MLLASPALALAVDRFVDRDTGTDAGGCTSSAAPCDTIGYAITQASPGDAILVDDSAGEYTESVTLGNGLSLTGFEFAGGGDEGFVTLTSAAPATVTVPASGAGQISGLRIRASAANATALDLVGAAQVTNNVFDSDTPDFSVGVTVRAGAGASQITANTFSDDGADTQVAISVAGSSPTIQGNSMSGFNVPLFINGAGAAPQIIANTITATCSCATLGRAISLGQGTQAIITRNQISAPVSSDAVGVFVIGQDGPAADATRVTMRRNIILDHSNGVFAREVNNAVSLNGDLIADSTTTGVFVADLGTAELAPPPLELTNVTVVGTVPTGVPVRLNGAAATIDSTIVGADGISSVSGSTCTISFSRGPATGTPADTTDCNDFQTTADPGFVNVAADDYHLSPGSPMVDMGNPAAPSAPNDVDFDSDPRAIDADGSCPLDRVRDIGADELNATEPNCEPAVVQPPVVPPPIVPPPIVLPPVVPPEDIDPPDTFITDKRSGGASKVKIKFRADEPGSTFSCKLDKRPFRPCSSPMTLRRLAPGKHKFAVRATDPAGNIDPTPAKVKLKAG